MYSRNSIGGAVGKKLNLMPPMKDVIKDYERSTFSCSDLCISRLGDLEDNAIGSDPVFKIYKVGSFVNPMEYYLCEINIITQLQKEYSLNYDQVFQLVYLACLMNYLPFYYYIL